MPRNSETCKDKASWLFSSKFFLFPHTFIGREASKVSAYALQIANLASDLPEYERGLSKISRCIICIYLSYH
jgi:hypothetical protein